jgi:cell division protein FtsQ
MARSLAAPAPRRVARRRARPGRARLALGLPRPLAGVGRIGRGAISFVWTRRRLRLALLAFLIALPLLGGGWLWLRHSSLVAVERVQVHGLASVHGADVGAIEAALMGAAHGMSTLDVHPAALRAAVAPYPIVRSVRAHASPPHGLRIEVVERPPVAALVLGGVRTAVAADGVVLGSGFLSSSLPVVSAGKAYAADAATPTPTPTTTTATSVVAPTTTLPIAGQSVRGSQLLGALTALGAVPAPLARVVTRAYSGSKGLTVVLRNGLLAYFGDGARPHAKWLSLARVLADPSSAGAAYIDVRLPERPAAGFAPGTTPPGASATETEPSSSSDPETALKLAAGVHATVGG